MSAIRHNVRDGAHRSIVHLEIALRDVDAEDISAYLPDDESSWIRRYQRELDEDDRGDSC